VAGAEQLNSLSGELSPDGTRVAYVAGTPPNIWLLDLPRNTRRPLTFGSSPASDPVWSPDGNRIAYVLNAGGAGVKAGIYRKNVSDSRDP
jgi:Tol biopolymer transport system component